LRRPLWLSREGRKLRKIWRPTRKVFDFNKAINVQSFLVRGCVGGKVYSSFPVERAFEQIKKLSLRDKAKLRNYLLECLNPKGDILQDKRQSGNAAELLSHLKNKAVFNAYKEVLLDSGQQPPYTRERCAHNIGKFKTRQAGDVLVEAIKREKTSRVLKNCLIGLGFTGKKRYGPILVSFLDHPRAMCRDSAAIGVRMLGYNPASEADLAQLKKKR